MESHYTILINKVNNIKQIAFIIILMMSTKLSAQIDSCKSIFDSTLNRTFYWSNIKKAQYKIEMGEFLENNLNITEDEEFIDAISYARTIIIYIDTSGTLVDVRIKNRPEVIHTKFDEKLISLFKSMDKWQPAKCEEVNVDSVVLIPIIF